MTDVTYPLAEVLKALDLTEDAVTNWSRRAMPGLVVQSSGRGRQRRLGMDAITRLALIKALVDNDIAVARAAQLANMCLLAMISQGPIKTMTIFRYPGKENLV